MLRRYSSKKQLPTRINVSEIFLPSNSLVLLEQLRTIDELNSDADKKISKLNSNLKSINQKIDNIVGVIANTGSGALLNTLENLEKEKQQLLLQINSEEQGTNDSKLS